MYGLGPRCRALLLRVLVAALGVSGVSEGQTTGPSVLTAAQWRADLRVLAEKVEVEHRNPWARVSRSAFQQAVAALESRIPSLADSAVVVEMAALVAMLGDGHSRLSLPIADGEAQQQAHLPTPVPAGEALLLRRYPVLLHWFDDGVYVTGATADHLDLVGLEVVRFGARSTAEALQSVRRVANADNEQWHKLMGPHLLSVAEVCQATGVVADPERLSLVVRDSSGVTREVVLAPLARQTAPKYVSAAMNLVSQMELLTNTLFAGEPTGSTPSHYGDARRFTLPSSGLTLRLSSIYWRDWNVNEKRPWVAPDLPVTLSGRDFFDGRDPVLDAVLAYKAPERIADQLLWVFRQGGIDAASRRFYFLQTDPATASADFFMELRRVGRTLLDEGRATDAARVFQQGQRLRPTAFDAYADLGEAQLAAGNAKDAVASLEKALSIRPGDVRVQELLTAARGR